MEGTGSPISFQSYACRVCQVGGQLPSGVPCLSTIGSMDDDVSCGSSQSHRCELLRRWGSCVIVGKCRKGVAPNNTGVALSGKSCFRDVLIGRSSLAGNPFVGAPRVRLCKAYDELLRLLLSNDLDYDRLALTFPHLVDDPGSGVASTTSFEKRILAEVASSHHVQLHDSYAGRFSIETLRAWVAYHARLLCSGQSLRLLCHCIQGAAGPWSCHGQGLAGALTWLALRDAFFDAAPVSCPMLRPAFD